MKHLFPIIFVLLLISSSSMGVSYRVQESSNVSSDGKTWYVGGNGPGNSSWIQVAINYASDGDTVFVYDDSSPYHEEVRVDKRINVIGENKYTTIIDGTGYYTIVVLEVDNIKFSGFTIKNAKYCGLGVESNYNEIYDNIFLNNNPTGIRIWDEYHNSIIKNNSIISSSDGITLRYDSHDIEISNNIISECKHGILINSANHTISQNIITNNEYGIFTSRCGNISFIENTLSHNDYCALWIGFNPYFNCTHNIITGNNITDNWYGFGIIVEGGSQLRPRSLYNLISGNNIKYNRVGIELGSNANTVTSNNFNHNIWNARFLGCRTNIWDNNFWNKPRTKPKPIFGLRFIIPFIPWVNYDRNPAQEPFDIGV